MEIILKNITKRFGKSFSIDDFNLVIPSGQFTTFLGPSGCGKTTVLRMIAGLETPDSGEIFFGEKCVFSSETKINIPTEKRNLGFVFQDFALWPHLNVFENVAFGLRAKKQKENLKVQVEEALSIVQLEDYSKRYPSQLSGGQQQRVAFTRAIVGNPCSILFDEPLSALDAVLREEMRTEIKRITSSLGITAVFVTHDQLEAMSISDIIVVMNKGKIEQIGTPEEIYKTPATKFTAGFIGKFNHISDNELIHPEFLSFEPINGSVSYDAKVVSVQFLGNTYELTLDVEGRKWTALSQDKRYTAGDKTPVYINKDKILIYE